MSSPIPVTLFTVAEIKVFVDARTDEDDREWTVDTLYYAAKSILFEGDIDEEIFHNEPETLVLFPEIIINAKEVYAYNQRNVSRAEIIAMMNYTLYDPYINLEFDEIVRQFRIGLRDILSVAIGMPRTTTAEQYGERFERKKQWNIFEGVRHNLEENCHIYGRIAAIYWLSRQDRALAERMFLDW